MQRVMGEVTMINWSDKSKSQFLLMIIYGDE